LLDLLDRTETKATFFVLGRVAQAYPTLIRDVALRGHEIGTHGHLHRRLPDLGEEGFRRDLRLPIETIERACGVRPRGHRAPEFSVTRRSAWAFDVLAEEGFMFDSSVFPIRHTRYGIPDAPTVPYRVECRGGRTLVEVPLTTLD